LTSGQTAQEQTSIMRAPISQRCERRRPSLQALLCGLLVLALTGIAGVGLQSAWAGQATLPPEFDAEPEKPKPSVAKPETSKPEPSRPETDRPKPPAAKPESKKEKKAAPSRFFKDALGVITDSKTGLQWYVGPDKDLNWNKADSWATGLKVGGGRWRLPTRAELQALSGSGDSEGLKLHPIFQLKHTFVWTGEQRDEVKVWVFSFGLGKEFADNRGLSNDVRAFAVRVR
jgi:hypothetical protein